MALAGLATAGLATTGLVVATPANAAGGVVVVPRPATATGLSYLRVSGRPGATLFAGSIELVNPSAKKVRVALAPVDGATLSTLGSTYAPAATARHGSTLWLRLREHTIAIAPWHGAVVPVVVAIPRGARAGDYLSGVSVEALDQRAPRASAAGGVTTASTVRYAIGVETSVVGRRRPLIVFTGAALREDPAGTVFLLDARNPGNVILQGVRGHVYITRERRTIISRSIPAGTFVANTAIAYPVPAFAERPPVGTRYLVSAWLRYPGGIARLRQTVTFGTREAALQHRYARKRHPGGGLSWWQLALLVAIVLYALLVTLALWRLLALRRRARDGAEKPVEREEERPRTPAGR